MRDSKYADKWIALRKRRALKISVEAQNLMGLPQVNLNIETSVFAIAGLNGSGKSVLLRAIWAGLDRRAAMSRSDVTTRVRGSRVKVTIIDNGSQKYAADIDLNGDANFGDAEPAAGVLHIDASSDASAVQRFFCNQINVEELVDAYGPRKLKDDEVEHLGYVLKKDYLGISIIEIDEFEDLGVVPFFKFETRDCAYDTRTASLGEIAVLTLYWKMSSAEKWSIVLLEEPETYLSEHSQRELMNLIAVQALTRNLQCVLTTHSTRMIEVLQKSEICYTYATLGGAVAQSGLDVLDVLAHLGVKPGFEHVCYVEDEAAKALVRAIIQHKMPSHRNRIEVVTVDGDGNLDKALEAIPKRTRSVGFIGVYDGDLRALERKAGLVWPYCFLPGETSIETQLKELVRAEPRKVARVFGRSEDDINHLYGLTAGLDPHDWFERFQLELQVDTKTAIRMIFPVWMAHGKNKRDVSKFSADLKKALSKKSPTFGKSVAER